MIRTSSVVAFACHSAACRPPGKNGGTGGSLPAGSSGRPWERPFEAGRWERVSDPEAVVDFQMRGFPSDMPEMLKQITRTMLMEQQRENPDGVRYINGNVMMTDWSGMDPSAARAIMREIDELQQAHPIGAIVNMSLTTLAPRVLGETHPLESVNEARAVRISTEVFKGIAGPAQHNNYFQTAAKMPIHRWVVAHEWGHALDTRKARGVEDTLYEKWRGDPRMSRYGKTSGMEAYAESFADWHTSGGQTTNPVSRAYASEYDWGTP